MLQGSEVLLVTACGGLQELGKVLMVVVRARCVVMQGRSWIAPPRDKRNEADNTFLPKRWIHTWQGHNKGVNAIRFFPGTGHLLLSAGRCSRSCYHTRALSDVLIAWHILSNLSADLAACRLP